MLFQEMNYRRLPKDQSKNIKTSFASSRGSISSLLTLSSGPTTVLQQLDEVFNSVLRNETLRFASARIFVEHRIVCFCERLLQYLEKALFTSAARFRFRLHMAAHKGDFTVKVQECQLSTLFVHNLYPSTTDHIH